MRIPTNQILKQLNGDPYTREVPGTATPAEVTLGFAVSNILSLTKSDEPLRSFTLAQKFYAEPEVEVSAEEIVFIKKLITESNVYIPYVTGSILSFFNV